MDVVVVAIGVAVTTVKVTLWLVIAPRVAVILVLPIATPAAEPAAEIVATVGSKLVQVTCDEISTPERPSEYVPEAKNAWALPTGKFDGDVGAMLIDDKGAVVTGFEEQAAVPRIEAAINPKVRQAARNRRCLIFIIVYPSSLEIYDAASRKVRNDNSIIIAPSPGEVNEFTANRRLLRACHSLIRDYNGVPAGVVAGALQGPACSAKRSNRTMITATIIITTICA